MSENAGLDNKSKWRVLAIFWLISFCNYADRTILSAVIPKLKAEFHTDDFRLGLISGIFLWVYACSAVASGYLADRHSRASMVRWGFLVWSSLFVLVSFTNSLPLFGFLLALTGVAEASYYPAGLALISSYHSSTRTKALSIHQTAVFTGIAVGGYAAARIAEAYSWRSAYLFFGCAGVLLAIGVWPILNGVGRPSKWGESVTSPPRKEGSTEKWKLLRAPGFIPLALLYVGANVVTYALLTWLPTFLHDARGMTLSDASKYGLGSWNLATLIAVMAGGVLGDRIVGRLGTVTRRVFLAASLALFGGSVSLLNLSPNLACTVAILLLAGTFKGLFDANIYAAVHDVVLPRDRATAVGTLTAFGFTGAAASSVIVGAAARTAGLGMGLSMAGLTCCLGAGLLVWVLRRKHMENPMNIGSFT
jgi:MFS family permease